SRAGLAVILFDWMRPSSQDLEASERVLKKRAAQSHLSIRTGAMIHFGVAIGGLARLCLWFGREPSESVRPRSLTLAALCGGWAVELEESDLEVRPTEYRLYAGSNY